MRLPTIAAGIQKRVQELLGVDQSDHQQTDTPATPQAVCDPAQAVCDQDNVHTPPAPLPEARASVNVHLTIAGRQVQLTLRDHDEGRLLARLEEVLQRFPLPQTPAQPQGQALSPQQHNAAAMHKQVTGFCAVHNCQMQENHKDGRTWWSHRKDDGTWCKGR